MLTIPQIVTSLRSSRASFGTIFDQAQLGLPAQNRLSFDSIALLPTDNENFTRALEYARDKHFLPGLVDWLIDQNLEDGTLTQSAADALPVSDPGADSLQSMVSTVRGFTQPDVMYRGILAGMRWTVKIRVQTTEQLSEGTGVLIAPHLVITAWHVVKPLFAEINNVWTSQPLGVNQLTVQFDDYLRFVRPNRPPAHANSQLISAADDWCVAFSGCHPDEYHYGLPQNLADLDGFWDYAIIRLNEAPGIERRWVDPDARISVPVETANFVLFQHAHAQSLKLDQGKIANINPPNPSFIPRFRFIHQANTLNGSSGGPCFDQNFMLFGLHQGEWSRNTTDEVLNRGVPIGPIIRHFKATNPNGLPPPGPELIPIWEVVQKGQRVPVIGLDAVQSLGWRLATLGGPRILIVTGSKGAGKTFSTVMLSAMLPEGGHLKINLHAGVIGKKDVLQLVEEICRNAGATLPTIKSATEIRSTQVTWIKSEVIPNLLSALESVRRGRLVWLMLTELNKSTIEGTGTSEFLFQLYEQVLTTDWLRVVLDDIQTDLSDSLIAVTERHRLREIPQSAIERFVKRFFGTLSEPISDLVVKGYSNLYTRKYDEFLGKDPAEAMKNIAIEITTFTDSFRNADQ